jgi:hypothetical protein
MKYKYYKNLYNIYNRINMPQFTKTGKVIYASADNKSKVMSSSSKSTPKNNWIGHTKEFAQKNKVSYGEALSNTKNRCQYYDTMIDRSKYNRGPNLLQPDHPAMHPHIPNLSPQDKKIKDEIYIQTKRSMCGKKPSFKKTT